MLTRPIRLTPTTFAAEIRRAPAVFVQLDRAAGRPFEAFVAGHFEARHPGRVAFATLSRAMIARADWWDHHFRSAAGPIRGGVADGMWLFEHGLVVGHHAGVSSFVDRDRFLAYFDAILDRRRQPADEERPPPPPRSPAAPPSPAAESPYVVLGVAPDADDDALRAAWKEAMKLNHPDRVSHLSAAIQRFAHDQTIAIQLAYDAIVAERSR